MASSRRTWCRTCGSELRLPRWRSAIGLVVATCDDEGACRDRYVASLDRLRRSA
jgi:hypothetical protein